MYTVCQRERAVDNEEQSQTALEMGLGKGVGKVSTNDAKDGTRQTEVEDKFFVEVGVKQVGTRDGSEEMEKCSQSEGSFKVEVEQSEWKQNRAGAKADATGDNFGKEAKDEKRKHR